MKFSQFATNWAISLRSCQSNRKLWNEVVNFTLNFMWKLRNSLWKKFAPFSALSWFGTFTVNCYNWITSRFKGKQFRDSFVTICSNCTKPTTVTPLNGTNLCHNELRNCHMKFSVKFTTSFQSSRFDWQLRNEIAQFVANLGNFKRTSETVCQKFCETHCKCVTKLVCSTSILNYSLYKIR